MYGSASESTDVILHGLNKAVKQIKPLRMKPPKDHLSDIWQNK